MEVSTSLFTPKDKINGKNPFYITYDKEADRWYVMQRFKTREDKISKVYKTKRGAENWACHRNAY